MNDGDMIEIGPHRLHCGDITTGAVARAMCGELADLIYSDPPWGPGNQLYWHTVRALGSSPRTDWPGFLAAFCGAVAEHRRAEAPVLVEMGVRWTSDLDAAMLRVGLPLRRRWTIFYGPRSKPLPNTLALYGPRDLELAVDGLHGEPVTREALRTLVRPGMVVLDPCTGLGMTARLTHRFGGRFRGSEMNAARLARTEAWLRKHCE